MPTPALHCTEFERRSQLIMYKINSKPCKPLGSFGLYDQIRSLACIGCEVDTAAVVFALGQAVIETVSNYQVGTLF